MSTTRGHRVVALVRDQVGLLDLAAPTHLFGYCGPPLYCFDMATCLPGRVRTSAGPDLHVELGLDALLTADAVVVPGYEDETAVIPPAALIAIRTAAARGTRIMSICTGAFALAEAGLLDGLTATTHRAAADLLASKYPAVKVQADKLYIDQGQILTSAGIAAGLDLCLHVIRRDYGAAIAAQFARRTVIAPHRDGGQTQFIDLPISKSADGLPGSGNTAIGRTRDWARTRLPTSLSIAQLAAHAQMSPRTFLRRFRAATGQTPAAWIAFQRVVAAQAMLESTGLSDVCPPDVAEVRRTVPAAVTFGAGFAGSATPRSRAAPTGLGASRSARGGWHSVLLAGAVAEVAVAEVAVLETVVPLPPVVAGVGQVGALFVPLSKSTARTATMARAISPSRIVTRLPPGPCRAGPIGWWAGVSAPEVADRAPMVLGVM